MYDNLNEYFGMIEIICSFHILCPFQFTYHFNFTILLVKYMIGILI